MSTFYVPPATTTSLPYRVSPHRSLSLESLARANGKSGGGPSTGSPTVGKDRMTATEGFRPGGSTLRSRSPLVPVVPPLRNRQLPASFWQEPNVPRSYAGYPLFLPHSFHLSHLHALWSAGSSASAAASSSPSGVAGLIPGAQTGGVSSNGSCGISSSSNSSSSSHNGSNKQSGHVHKEFLERLQSAQTRGYDLAASRFPITEFLFYNYGLRSYLEPGSSSSSPATSSASSSSSSSSPPSSAAGCDHSPAAPCSMSGAGRSLPLPRSCPSVRPDAGATPEKLMMMGVSKFCNGQAGAGAGGGVHCLPQRVSGPPNGGGGGGGGGNGGLTFPTLCPYLGYNCPNLHSHSPHRFWDCVLGQAAAFSSSSSSNLCETMNAQSVGGGLWKPGSGSGSGPSSRTHGAYGGRFHPFAIARGGDVFG